MSNCNQNSIHWTYILIQMMIHMEISQTVMMNVIFWINLVDQQNANMHKWIKLRLLLETQECMI